MAANVLSQRDTNVQVKPSASPEKPKSLDYHRQVLQSRMEGEQYANMKRFEMHTR